MEKLFLKTCLKSKSRRARDSSVCVCGSCILLWLSDSAYHKLRGCHRPHCTLRSDARSSLHNASNLCHYLLLGLCRPEAEQTDSVIYAEVSAALWWIFPTRSSPSGTHGAKEKLNRIYLHYAAEATSTLSHRDRSSAQISNKFSRKGVFFVKYYSSINRLLLFRVYVFI